VSQGKNSKKKKRPPRHRVSVGDMVMFYTPNQHMTGVLGEVTDVLRNQRVVAKCLAPNDTDYEDQYVVLRTRKPEGVGSNGEEKHFYACYVTKVIVRAQPKPPKEPKKLLPAKVIETTEELLDHLHSDSKEKVVVQLQDQEQAS
jgi:hypothetical protein